MTPDNQEFQPPFTTKESILQALRDVFTQWDDIFRDFDGGSAEKVFPGSDWNIKHVAAHLMAWQQVTNARVLAVINEHEPVLPGWLEGSSPESESQIDTFNGRIKQSYQSSLWPEIYRMWRDGFENLIEMAEKIAEEDLLDGQKFAWLHGYPLIAVLFGTLDHHQEHLEWFQ